MFCSRCFVFGCVVLVGAVACLAAGPVTDSAVLLFNGKDLEGWSFVERPDGKNHWTIGIARVHPLNSRALLVSPRGPGPKHLVHAGNEGWDIASHRQFGDCAVSLDVMVPLGGRSGIFLLGEYEVLQPDDLGGVGNQPPARNAAKPFGSWNHIEIVFQAPRFEGDKKVKNARFVRVVVNGQVIQQDVEVEGVSPGGLTGEEKATGPLVLEGKQGPVAFRNIVVTPH